MLTQGVRACGDLARVWQRSASPASHDSCALRDSWLVWQPRAQRGSACGLRGNLARPEYPHTRLALREVGARGAASSGGGCSRRRVEREVGARGVASSGRWVLAASRRAGGGCSRRRVEREVYARGVVSSGRWVLAAHMPSWNMRGKWGSFSAHIPTRHNVRRRGAGAGRPACSRERPEGRARPNGPRAGTTPSGDWSRGRAKRPNGVPPASVSVSASPRCALRVRSAQG
jgi:hypothetical protein